MDNKTLSNTVLLNNGVSIPILGYGTMPSEWGVILGNEFVGTIKNAIKVGYRNIDTASIYHTEEHVGKAVRQCIAENMTNRQELFISTKVWNTDRGYDRTLNAFDASMKRLGLDYLDLYLIHTPAVARWHDDWREINYSTWHAFEQLYKEGRIKAIGVSNFLPHHLQALIDKAEIMPMVNQIEVHPGFNSAETIDYCQKHGIIVEAWGPFGNGQILSNEKLQSIATRYHKSVAQLCLRWLVQKGIIPLPKSLRIERMTANTQIFDFHINGEDMKQIDEIPPCGGFCVDADNAPED